MGNNSHYRKCIHCGDGFWSVSSPYCCKGCKTVYELIQNNSIQIVNKVSERNDYSYLDSDSFLKHYTEDKNRISFFVEGIHCSQCFWLLENLTEICEDVEYVDLDMSKNIIQVVKKSGARFSEVASTLSALGYRPHPVNKNSDINEFQKKSEKQSLLRLGVSAFCTGNIMLMVVPIYSGSTGFIKNIFDWTSFALILPVVFYAAVPFWKTLWRFIVFRKAHIDLPIAVAIAFGFVLSTINLFSGSGDLYFDSIAALVTLILATRYLLVRVKSHYFNEDHLLSSIRSKSVKQIKNNNVSWVDACDLRPGDVIELSHKDRLVVDGELVDNIASFNMSVIDGESTPRDRRVGESIISGAQLVSQCARVEVVRDVESSYIGKTFKQLQSQAFNKGQLVSLSEKYSEIFTKAILLIAFLVFVFLSFSLPMEQVINRVLALIIIACPCALAFSLPLVQSLSLLKASRSGIIIKSVEVLERMKNLKNVIFDKTGTLTSGDFNLVYSSTVLSQEQKNILYSLEQHSNHPVAAAIIKHLKQDYASIEPVTVDSFEEQLGKGVSGVYKGETYSVGAAKSGYEDELLNVVEFKKGDELIATFKLGDQIKSDSKKIVEQLNQKYQVYLLSGDREKSVSRFAKMAGVVEGNYFFNQSPREKQQFVEGLKNSMMVGDGLNDLQALSQSQVSVAVSGSVEAALKSSDVYLTRDSLGNLNKLFALSANYHSIILRNLLISFAYNLTAGVLAVFGFIDPLAAAILMPVSSLVILISTLAGFKMQQKTVQTKPMEAF